MLNPQKHEQGFAMVAVLITTLVLFTVITTTTGMLTVSSRQSITDQKVVLATQYAAESGLARAQKHVVQALSLMGVTPPGQTTPAVQADVKGISIVDQSITPTKIDQESVLLGNLQKVCGDTNWNPKNTVSTEANRAYCTLNAAAAQPGAFFGRYVVPDAAKNLVYPSAVTTLAQKQAYWNDLFNNSQIRTTVTAGITTNLVYGLQTTSVNYYRNGGNGVYEIRFRMAPITSQGSSGSDKRNLTLQPSTTEYVMTFARDSFSKYALFRNNIVGSRGGNNLWLGSATFDGPVHTNGTSIGFSGTSATLKFKDEFTTVATSLWSGSACGPNTSDTVTLSGTAGNDCANIFAKTPKFGQSKIDLPANDDTLQKRASIGSTATTPATDADVAAEMNVPASMIDTASTTKQGVFYSAGNGTTKNMGGDFKGGIYVNGDAQDIQFSKTGNYQKIAITQFDNQSSGVAPTTRTVTTFQENSDGSWTVTTVVYNASGVAQPASTKVISNNPGFNGMLYVNGRVRSLRGDGNDATPDIAANTQITLAAAGDIYVTDSVTYTDNPRTNSDADNVLGLYSSGGKVWANPSDAPNYNALNSNMNKKDTSETDTNAFGYTGNSKSISIHASIMASSTGNGFGGRRWGTVLSNPPPVINILGGIIEDQSPGVSNSSGVNGYTRNYAYDPRFRTGFAPPYFPTQPLFIAKELTAINTHISFGFQKAVK